MAASELQQYPDYIIVGGNFYDEYQKKRPIWR